MWASVSCYCGVSGFMGLFFRQGAGKIAPKIRKRHSCGLRAVARRSLLDVVISNPLRPLSLEACRELLQSRSWNPNSSDINLQSSFYDSQGFEP